MSDDFEITIIGDEMHEQLPTETPRILNESHRVWGDPAQEIVRILFGPEAYRDIDEHAHSTLRNEVGGLLLGRAYTAPDMPQLVFVEAIASVRAYNTEASATHVKFDPETWSMMLKEKDEKHPDLRIVGWYHTHPNMSVFVSGYDIDAHRQFPEPWHIALVVAPQMDRSHTTGGFFIPDARNRLRRVDGFYELLDGGSTISWMSPIEPRLIVSSGIREDVSSAPSPVVTSKSSVKERFIWLGAATLALGIFGFVVFFFQQKENNQQFNATLTHLSGQVILLMGEQTATAEALQQRTATATLPATPIGIARRELPVYSGPSITFPLVHTLEVGQQFIIRGISPDAIWYWVSVPSEVEYGWVTTSRIMIDFLGNPSDIVIVTLTSSPTPTSVETATSTITPTAIPTATDTPTTTNTPVDTPSPSPSINSPLPPSGTTDVPESFTTVSSTDSSPNFDTQLETLTPDKHCSH